MADRRPPTGTVAFLFTDIEGSTVRWQADRDAMGSALARHDALLRREIEAHGGYVFKTVGDAFCAVFVTVPAAAGAAFAAQRALAAETWGDLGPIRVRMAVHVGVAEEREADYFGPAVNRVARLLATGHGGQVLLSGPAAELLHDVLPAGTALRDLGEYRLKDLTRPERVFQLLAADLADAFPPLRTLDHHPHNLPLALTPFVGREAEIAFVRETLLRPEVRLVTLTGPGGVGKTRLALQAAAEAIDDFPDGVFFVPLEPVGAADLVVQAIAGVLDLREAGGQTLIQVLTERLRGATALLVLDNFEHVTAAAALLPPLLRVCPRLTVAVTSRATLRVYGEHEVIVSPLDSPPPSRTERMTAADAQAFAAVRLFVTRAREAKADFALTDGNAFAVAEICRRLDGLPLAIELAAARVRLLPPRAMLPRLENRLALLTGGARDRPERQQTLRAAIAWSHDLLGPDQQRLFARLGVFAGGCTFEAVEHVCVRDDDLDAFAGIEVLVEHSLLRQDEADGEARFTMLNTLREFALEHLAADGEEEGWIRERHGAHFLDIAARVAEELEGPEGSRWLYRLEAESDNLRAALETILAHGEPEDGLRFVLSLVGFWQLRGLLSEGAGWLERALIAAPSAEPTLRARALNNLGILANERTDYGRARSSYEASLAIWRELDHHYAIATVLNNLGQLAGTTGDYDRAKIMHEESLALVRLLEDRDGLAFSLDNLGHIAHLEGNLDVARRLQEEALEIRRSMDDIAGAAYSARALAHLARDESDSPRARRLLDQAIAGFRDVGDHIGVAEALADLADLDRETGAVVAATEAYTEALTLWREISPERGFGCLGGVAALAFSRGRLEQSARLFAAAAALREAIGERIWPFAQTEEDRLLAELRRRLGEEGMAIAWAAGRAMSPDVAIDEALAEVRAGA